MSDLVSKQNLSFATFVGAAGLPALEQLQDNAFECSKHLGAPLEGDEWVRFAVAKSIAAFAGKRPALRSLIGAMFKEFATPNVAVEVEAEVKAFDLQEFTLLKSEILNIDIQITEQYNLGIYCSLFLTELVGQRNKVYEEYFERLGSFLGIAYNLRESGDGYLVTPKPAPVRPDQRGGWGSRT